MDLRVYYQKIRSIEAEIREPFAVIVSRETPDGGRAGVKSEVPRAVAAKLVAEGKADLASPEVAANFRAQEQKQWRLMSDAAETERVPAGVRKDRVSDVKKG